ncbi:Nitroreductase [Cnuella takakiae]|uniref:Nitroreductase n=1 Tax=Cnuella takakiae TaxID=1302690 RepID=A0A1M4XY47_9BACT|nr:NAD(P)H-dependent oxidoreductase [Cnuella takakiae]OLY94859.1 NAD(P)H-dependent oxidoreductase [Cnuella takakiae]SHE98365.1 Nitroreductase [Cnuella takakiae]
MNLIDALNWRYAAKRMNGNIVPAEKIQNIIEAARLAPSSMGLQPYNVLVISNPELKAKLQPAAYNQPQIVEASHLLVFAAWENVTAEHVETYINDIAATRGIPAESLDGFKASLMGIVNGRTHEQKHEWAARQAYIAFGTAIAAAAIEQVDATPMEGFVPDQVDAILGLREKGLRSVTILALGYRDASTDFLATSKKVRRSRELFVDELA